MDFCTYWNSNMTTISYLSGEHFVCRASLAFLVQISTAVWDDRLTRPGFSVLACFGLLGLYRRCMCFLWYMNMTRRKISLWLPSTFTWAGVCLGSETHGRTLQIRACCHTPKSCAPVPFPCICTLAASFHQRAPLETPIHSRSRELTWGLC